MDLLVFNCLTFLSLVWQRGVGVGGRERKQRFWRMTGQQARRDPHGLKQIQASIDKRGSNSS